MTHYELNLENGHLIATVGRHRLLLDTGSPTSFGNIDEIEIAGERFHLGEDYMGLDVSGLKEMAEVTCDGLLGMDILGHFDHRFDLFEKKWTVAETLTLDGEKIGIDIFMGVPICEVTVEGNRFRLFFDTGASIGYLLDDLLDRVPSDGTIRDFYPGFGTFETPVHPLDVEMGGSRIFLAFGKLPDLLGATLKMAGVDGILGNEIIRSKQIGFSPKKGTIWLI